MKSLKIIGGVIIVLVAIITIAVFIGLKNINSLVEMAIEDFGTSVTKTPVLVDSVDIQITQGRGEIKGISVKNLPGYRADNVIALGDIVLHIDPASLTQPVVVIKQLSIDGAKLTAEHKGLADVNLQQLYENITTGNVPAKEEPKMSSARPDLRFMLEKVAFTNISLDLISEEYGQRELTMKDIQLANLGNKKEGLTAEQLTNALLTPVVNAARKRANSELKDLAKKELQDKLGEKLSDDDKEKLKTLKSWLK